MSHSHHAAQPWAEAPAPAVEADRKEAQGRLFPILAETFSAALEPLDSWGLTAVVEKARLHGTLQFLRDSADWKFDMLVDITAVDYLNWPGHEGPRFVVIYNLKSVDFPAHRVRIKVWVEEEDLQVPTVSDLWPIADWQERETWDQYGIVFAGHPNLKRLLNHHEFVGHPLRKDYPAQRRQKLSMNDPMVDQLEARLRKLGYTVLDPVPAESPQIEDVLKGDKR
jgi:NADH-quinone oxidoreductase subunit C